MEGSWSRLIVSLTFLYVVLNVFFAGLYLIEPGSIGNARTTSFADAFFFSVQTFSTIGYGAMLPATPYGNLVVTAEAASSLLGAALATGIMFAKAARPHSSALFSKALIMTRYNGVPSLILRVANARGNDVVDATVSVTVLKEEVSTEGHHMRRQHDLALIRNRTPFFTLTWTVIHPVDQNSPLRGVDWANPNDVLGIVCTLIGHDGTYAQTTYARQIYTPEDVRVGHRFVDVLSELDDGRLLIDYSKFHDTELDEKVSAPPAAGSGAAPDEA
jgi:inward rectifier potassium channel